MVKRRLIRVLTPYSKTGYFVHNGVTRGLVYDVFRQFETDLNLKLKSGTLKVNVVLIPTTAGTLEQKLLDGQGDVVALPAMITEERLERVDFTNPTATNVSELIVTGPGGPEINSLDDLSGKTLYVFKAWAYWKDMEALSAKFVKEGKAPIRLIEAPDSLEAEDLLEMVNAGIAPATAAHDRVVVFWSQILTKLKYNKAAAVKTGAQTGWAVRKGNPLLKAELNSFIAKYPEGSATRNVLLASYLKSTRFVKSSTSPEERARLENLVNLFRKYGDKYGMDFLLMAAQGYQESGLNQTVKSPVGAVGVMQLMPPTGKEMNVGDISQLEPNIHAGVKFIRFMMDQYYGKEPDLTQLNKGLFTFASYNAGPARIAQMRKLAAARGLDPNVWFGNVEVITAEKVGRETVNYVSNIYKYYLGYKLMYELRQERDRIKKEMQSEAGKK
jgi:membrane-bound lytic murein transglycosylase MltF